MDSLAEVATAAGMALVGAMATDAWVSTRTGVARLFARAGAQRRAAVETRLDTDAALVERAADPAHVRQGLVPAWHDELLRLVTEYPDAEADLETLIRQIRRPYAQTQVNVARDNGRVFGAQGGNIVYYAGTTPPPLRRPETDVSDDGGQQ